MTCVFRRKNLFIIPFAFDSPQSQKEKKKIKVVIDGHSVGVVCLNVWERRRRRKTGLSSLSPNKEKSTNEESMSKRSTGPGVVKKERRKKAFDDFDGEEAKTLTTTRKRG